MASSQENKVIDGSSIIDMEVIDGDDSDYETNISGNITRDDDMYGRKRTKESSSTMDDMQKKVTQNVASYVWQSGSQQAKSVFNNYANVDLLRPYFNVEPYEVRQRLLHSLVPQKPGVQKQKVPRELYGPTMLIFTLIALLLFQMKTGGHTVQEGTLMGTAFGTCFGYWLGVSSFMWFLTYVCNTHITMLQILSLLGYALFGHCVVLGLTTVFHTSHDHMFFYLMWAIFGGLSTLKMISVFLSRTAGKTQRLIVCGVVSFLHLCFLLYLHFAYHQMVEELSDMIQNAGPPPPGLGLPAAQHKIAERSVSVQRNINLNTPPVVAGVPALQVKSQKEQAPLAPLSDPKAQIKNEVASPHDIKQTEAAKPLAEQNPIDVAQKAPIIQADVKTNLSTPKIELANVKKENKLQEVLLDAKKN